MKLRSITEAFRYPTLIQGRGESDEAGSEERRQRRERQGASNGAPKRQDPDSYSEAEVSAAVSAFQSDTQAQASGIAAVVEGSGPGLRVQLKDGSGAVIRQFTGAEFLELRDSVARDGSGRGKILDRKL